MKKTVVVETFSNGTEYGLFLEKNCFKCRHYVGWEVATAENPECSIEADIAEAMFNEDKFPEGKIMMDIEDGKPYIPHCVDFTEV